MATAKKTTKAATRAKKAPAKTTKTTASRQKAAPKRAATTKTRTVSAAAKRPATRRSSDDRPFFTIRATHETLYWVILGAAVIALASWVMVLTIRIQDLYNQMEINNANNMVMVSPKASSTNHE